MSTKGKFLPVAERVESNYVVTESGCWEWTGRRNAGGRGVLGVRGRPVYAYRVAYEMWVGPIPEGMQINHHCDNPGCINPNHLYPGTQLENVRDMHARGRASAPPVRYGTDNNKAVLNPDRVRAMREMAAGGSTTLEVARHFGMSEYATRSSSRPYLL